MRKRRVLIALLLACSCLLAAGLLLSVSVPAVQAGPDATSPNFAITWEVIASGGGVMTSDNYTVSATYGQPYTGRVTSANYAVDNGYWVAFRDFVYRLFAPFITGD